MSRLQHAVHDGAVIFVMIVPVVFFFFFIHLLMLFLSFCRASNTPP